MKNFSKLLLITLLTGLYSCGGSQQSDTLSENDALNYWVFGDTISPETTIKAAQLVSLMAESDFVETAFEGTVVNVCQTKGCWMTLDLENGEVIRVTFKDYGFFVPKDIDGKTLIVEGFAYTDTITVESLKHYGFDAGWSQEEIDAITEPEIELLFEAHGVLLAKEPN